MRAPAHKLLIEQAVYWAHNRILWAGPHRTPGPMQQLARELGKALRHAGFALERRPFAAHVTLIRKARAPHAPSTPATLPPLPQVDWPVNEFLLVRSNLSSEGSRYAVLERFPLQGRS